MLGQPLLHTLRLAVSEQINNLMSLHVHQDRAEALATSPTPIVHPDNLDLTNFRHGEQKHRPEYGSIGNTHSQLVTQTFSSFATGGKPDLLHCRTQPLGQA